uniref:Uncharacterized protein n=1 Tax=Meloidogyne enterolobii TaxID=390850 RepID=A0A6V7X1Q9_MELEN|nr:unnamed protein product [Meloidogyne enterolobii]
MGGVKIISQKMANFKFERCYICNLRLLRENVCTLRTCNSNHQYHVKCIRNWISGGCQQCPRCRVHATLDDIKPLHVEQADNDDGDSDNELTQSTSNMTIQDPAPMESYKINVIIKDLNNVKITINDIETNSTVAELKRRIEQANRTPVAEQRLTYGGKQLEDDKTLQYYKHCKE